MALDLVRPDGAKVDAALTDKKVHNTEELDREKQFAEATYNRIMQAYVAAHRQDPKKPLLVKADAEETRRIAGEDWRAFAKARNANSVAKEPLDEELVYKHIDQGRAQAEQQMRMKRALHELEDLEEFGFKLVGAVPQGFLWISLNCAVACAPKGPVYVWVRTVREDMPTWCSGWMPSPTRDPVIEMHDYSVEGLSGLLLHLGIPGVRPLSEDQMELCRQRVAQPMAVLSDTGSASPALGPIALCIAVAAFIISVINLLH